MQNTELTEYLNESLFIADIEATTKDGVLEEMVQLLFKQNIIKDTKILLSTIKQREILGSTGIGRHVAIPHCRSLAIPRLILAIGISKSGIDFDALDNEKVNLIFLIVGPPQEEGNNYLPLLGTLVEKIRDDELRKLLIDADNFESFYQIIQGGNK